VEVCQEHTKKCQVYTRKSFPNVLERDGLDIIHLNGYVNSVPKSEALNDFALTLTSYIEESLVSSTWATLLRQDFALAEAIFFVGYSMYDLDISRILFQDPDFKRKTFHIQHEGLSRADELALGRYGAILKVGTHRFADAIGQVLAEGGPTIDRSLAENFAEHLPPSMASTFTVDTKSISNLLEKGIVEDGMIFGEPERGSAPYYVNRDVVTDIVRSLSSHGGVYLISGDIGNGKTLCMMLLSKALLRAGYRVFSYEPVEENLTYDIEFFRGLESRFVLFIEDFYTNREIVEAVMLNIQDVRIVSTIRTSVLEIKHSEVKEILGSRYVSYSIDKLSSNEIENLEEIITKAAYWGSRAADSIKERRRYIIKDCNSELRSVLMDLVIKSDLIERVKGVFSRGVGQNTHLFEAVVVGLFLNFIEESSDFRTISELLGVDVFRVVNGARDSELVEFFAFKENKMEARSPILSSVILKRLVKDDKTIELALKCLKRISATGRSRTRKMKNIEKKLMRFSFTEKILKDTGNKESKISYYYDRVGDLGHKNKNPLYWLQFAIASNTARDYSAASRQFETAFKIAESFRHPYDTYQIENHYARFLLESRINSIHWNDHFHAFEKAHSLLLRQMNDVTEGYYPFRVVALYKNFVSCAYKNFDRKESERVKDMCRDVIDICSSHGRKNYFFVKKAFESASSAFDIIDAYQKSRGW